MAPPTTLTWRLHTTTFTPFIRSCSPFAPWFVCLCNKRIHSYDMRLYPQSSHSSDKQKEYVHPRIDALGANPSP